jgi:environmental stress-induced protein Ves
MITPFNFSSLPRTPWKNGGGETREIVSVPSPDADARFWRASIATLEHDGPFSRFSGIDRIITLIEGQPLWLRGEGIHHHLRRWEPWAFSGEWALAAKAFPHRGWILTL